MCDNCDDKKRNIKKREQRDKKRVITSMIIQKSS